MEASPNSAPGTPESAERVYRYWHRPDGWHAPSAKVVFEFRGTSILEADGAYEAKFGERPGKVPFLGCEILKPEEADGSGEE